jgi:hypothetical protein
MSLKIDDFHQLDWGLRLAWFENQSGDGKDLILWQSDCPNCGDDCYVRLHPCHFSLLARELGTVPAEKVNEATERLKDRLAILHALIEAHTAGDSPLRIAAGRLLPGVEGEAKQTDAPPSGSVAIDKHRHSTEVQNHE